MRSAETARHHKHCRPKTVADKLQFTMRSILAQQTIVPFQNELKKSGWANLYIPLWLKCHLIISEKWKEMQWAVLLQFTDSLSLIRTQTHKHTYDSSWHARCPDQEKLVTCPRTHMEWKVGVELPTLGLIDTGLIPKPLFATCVNTGLSVSSFSLEFSTAGAQIP